MVETIGSSEYPINEKAISWAEIAVEFSPETNAFHFLVPDENAGLEITSEIAKSLIPPNPNNNTPLLEQFEVLGLSVVQSTDDEGNTELIIQPAEPDTSDSFDALKVAVLELTSDTPDSLSELRLQTLIETRRRMRLSKGDIVLIISPSEATYQEGREEYLLNISEISQISETDGTVQTYRPQATSQPPQFHYKRGTFADSNGFIGPETTVPILNPPVDSLKEWSLESKATNVLIQLKPGQFVLAELETKDGQVRIDQTLQTVKATFTNYQGHRATVEILPENIYIQIQ